MKTETKQTATDKKLAKLEADPKNLAAVIRSDDMYLYKVLPLAEAIKVAADRMYRWKRPFVVATVKP